jgi:hypothetical protein
MESELLNASYTKSQMQAVFANWLAACKQLPGAAARQALTISSGVIAPTAALVEIDTEGAAATDDLTNIDYTNMPDGAVLVLYQSYSTRAVTLKHLAGGSGQLELAGGVDRVLSGQIGLDAIVLYRLGSYWKELSFLSTDVDLGGGITAKSTGQIGRYSASAGSNVDLNALTTSGVYHAGALGQTNGPGFSTGLIRVFEISASHCVQVYHEYGMAASQRMSYRRRLNGEWGAWVEIQTTGLKDAANGYMGLDASRRASLYGSLLASTDNAYDIGAAETGRVRNLYLVNNPTVGSDERDKTDVVDSPLGLDFIRDLRPVAYRIKVGDQWVDAEPVLDEQGQPVIDADGQPVMREVVKSRPGARTHFGLLAQQVKSVLPAGQDFAGWIKTDPDDPESREALRYEQFISPLIKAVQEQQSQIEALKAELATLRTDLAGLPQ